VAVKRIAEEGSRAATRDPTRPDPVVSSVVKQILDNGLIAV